MIEKAQKEDLKEILELQYLAYQSEAKLFGDMDIPPLKQTIEEVGEEFAKGTVLKVVDDSGDIIGSVGDTADIESAIEPHLHIEIMRGGKYQNPADFIKAE